VSVFLVISPVDWGSYHRLSLPSAGEGADHLNPTRSPVRPLCRSLRPERFQDTKEQFDIIVTVEERVYDLVVMHMESMESVDNRPVHVLNVDVVDNAEDALMGAFVITDMINMV